MKEKDLYGREDLLPQIARALMKMRTNDAMLVGPSGVGKTAIIQDLHVVSKKDMKPSPLAYMGRSVSNLS